MNNWKRMLLGWMLSAIAVTQAGTISLRWDAVPGATSYRVFYGTSAGNYSQVLSAGANTSATIQGLSDCTQYFVAVKAVNGVGESAAFSNEVAGWSRPELDGYSGTVQQGEQFSITLDGANFQPGADLQLVASPMPTDVQGNPLVRLESYTVQNCGRITASLSVEPLGRGSRAMPVGNFAMRFEVTNPDDVFGSEPATLTVEFDTYRADINRSNSQTTDRVDGLDLSWLQYAHATNEGDPRFNPDADLDGDGVVDGTDLAMLLVDFGECWGGVNWDPTVCP